MPGHWGYGDFDGIALDVPASLIRIPSGIRGCETRIIYVILPVCVNFNRDLNSLKNEKDFCISIGSGFVLLRFPVRTSPRHESGVCQHGGFVDEDAGFGFGATGFAGI